MKCPKCNNMDSKVIDTRLIEDGQTTRRRRECEFCNFRFTTFERKEFTDLMVVKKNGTKELYDRQKIKKALMLAFAKRQITTEQIDSIITNLEIQRQTDKNEISSSQIWDDILEILKEIDLVAYVRFASVYKSFDNIEDFGEIIKKVK